MFQERKLNAEINSDLANAKNIIIINAELIKNQPKLYEQMHHQYLALDAKIKQLTEEQKLFLLVLVFNLMLGAYLKEQTEEEMGYKKKLDDDYASLIEFPALTNLQRGKWYITIAKVYSLTGYPEDADKFCAKAIECIKQINKKNKLKLILLDYYTDRMNVNFLAVEHFEKLSAPALVHEAYQRILATLNEVMSLSLPDHYLISFYHKKVQALDKIASISYRNKSTRNDAILFWFQALDTFVRGLSVAKKISQEKVYLQDFQRLTPVLFCSFPTTHQDPYFNLIVDALTQLKEGLQAKEFHLSSWLETLIPIFEIVSQELSTFLIEFLQSERAQGKNMDTPLITNKV